MKRIAQLEKSLMKENVPVFDAGDTVKVHVKIREGDKERIQVFQGTVIGRRGGGINETFSVRKTSFGIGVERVFPLHSPNVSNIERIRQGKVRRSKLYYLRELTGKSARIEEKLDDKPAEKKPRVKKAKKAKKEEKVEAKAKKVKKDKKAKKTKKEEKAETKAQTVAKVEVVEAEVKKAEVKDAEKVEVKKTEAEVTEVKKAEVTEEPKAEVKEEPKAEVKEEPKTEE